MTSTHTTHTLSQELAAIVGRENVNEPAPVMDAVRAQVEVTPATAEEVAAVVSFAYQHDLVVIAAGGLTKQGIGRPPQHAGIVLRTGRLNRVERYDPGDLTIGVGAGITLAELDRHLGAHGQWLPLDAACAERASVGGALATAAHGPLKHAFGGAREFCVGVQFVTGDGKLAKAGGHVVKNVAGYDLMKLMIGSFGTLAVIVGANFKVFPRPRQTRTLVCEFGSAEAAIAFRDLVLRSPLTPLCLELISPHATEYVSPQLTSALWRVLVRGSGSDAVLARYARELGSAVAREISGNDEAQLWRGVSDFAETLVQQRADAMVLNAGVALQSVGPGLATAQRAAAANGFAMAAIGRIGVGSLLIAFLPAAGQLSPPQYAHVLSALRPVLAREGTIMVARCPGEVKALLDIWGASPNDLAAMRAIKQALDPKEVLNRGRFLF